VAERIRHRSSKSA